LIVRVVRCPDCQESVEIPDDAQSDDLVECPNCAGHALRVREENGGWEARLTYRVSCPDCNLVITLPEGAKAGDLVSCCGQTYTLTFEFGAFATDGTGIARHHQEMRAEAPQPTVRGKDDP
jgi:hypothetical protein